MRPGRGKHNDLENVGRTARHTPFRDAGEFSFGDYFKAEAIRFAWDLLTRVYGLPGDLLYASVYEEDDEAYQLWQEVVGLPTSRIVPTGGKGQFLVHGRHGPLRAVLGIIIDQGPAFGCARRPAPRLRLRPLPGALEPGLHAVQPDAAGP